MQTVIVILCIGAAVFFIGRKFYKEWTGDDDGHGGCHKCG
ncbi:MAG: FeoB-associated Cys-rich membrane protein [Crocinitomicaceae bacterium]|nr:FeoB-associated Cys-rich membrane protein [Crocinitomicaceae bacterium]